MTWNYRVMYFADGEESYWSINEVYYDKQGKPNGYIASAKGALWTLDGDGPKIVADMLKAFDKPVLTPADFGVKTEQNQCDGCVAGFAINEQGNHVNANGIAFMSCQRGKYGNV